MKKIKALRVTKLILILLISLCLIAGCTSIIAKDIVANKNSMQTIEHNVLNF